MSVHRFIIAAVLLAASAIVDRAPAQVVFDQGLVTITSTDAAETILVSQVGDQVVVDIDGSQTPFDADQVEAKSIEIAIRLAEQAPAATRWTKHTLNHWLRQAAPIFDASLALEFIGFAGPEGKEGIDAFLQKRPAAFPVDTKA